MEVAAILVGIAVAIIYYRQLREMHKATVAAQDAANVAHDALVLDARPWVGLTGGDHVSAQIVNKSPIKVNLEIKNFGKTPAFNEASFNNLTFHIVGQPMPSFSTYSREDAGPTITLMPTSAAFVDIGTDKPSKLGKTLIVDQATVDAINITKTIELFVYGSVWYEDVFGKPHRTDYCLQYIPSRNPKQTNFGACQTHNYAD